jgi:4-amino-4-deoxy-L-arabinose transferase-like glycosyltransferase
MLSCGSETGATARADGAIDFPAASESGQKEPSCGTGPAPTNLAALCGGVAVAMLAAGIFFFHLGSYGLWEPDEARYAEIAREMIASSNFVVPHLNYVPYIEKPPLLYWLTAASMRLLGVDEFSARLPNAAAALIAVLATWFFTLRIFDHRRAILAGAVLACSGLYAVMAQVLTTDMLLTATMTVSLFALFLQWREGGRWWLAGYLAMALAVLAKGPVAVAIPILAGAIFLGTESRLRHRIGRTLATNGVGQLSSRGLQNRDGDGRSSVMRRLHITAGLILVAVAALPWFVAITMRQPDFPQFYLIGEHLRRFMEGGYSHREPIYYYLPVLTGGFLPWTLALPLIPWQSFEPNPARRFCLIVIATVFILFSLASSKLVPYILPAFPFLAVITADGLMAFDGAGVHGSGRQLADPRRLTAMTGLLMIAGGAIIAIAASVQLFQSPYPAMIRPALYAAGAVVSLCAVVASGAFWRRRFRLGMGLLVVGAASTLIIVSYGRIMLEPTRSYAVLARRIERIAPDAKLICYPRYVQSLPFYGHRRVIVVGAKTELAYGAAHVPDASQFFFTSRSDLLRLWKEAQPAVLVIDRKALPQIQKSLEPYKVIASDSKKLALERVAAAGER